MKGYLQDIRPMGHHGDNPRKKQPEIEEEEVVIRHVPKSVVRPKKEVYRPEPVDQETRYEYEEPKQSWTKIVFIVLGVLVVLSGLIYGVSYLLRQADVVVTPKTVSGAVTLNANAVKGVSNPLSYELITLPESKTVTVTATHTDNVTTKATGTVVVFNFQSVAQSLVANTRFADANGTVFRLQNPVTIPKKTVSGTKVVPGQATVTLTADIAGPAGNIPLSDFSIVSFQGTAKEKLVYGRGKTPFTGGSSGSAFFLSDDEYTTAVTPLTTALTESLQADIVKQVPDGYVLLPNSLAFIPDTATNKNPGPSTSVSIPVTYSGSMQGVLLKKTELTNLVIKNIDPEETVSPSDVTVTGIDTLTYKVATDMSTGTLPASIPLTIGGNASVIWNIDKPALAQALVGTQQSIFTTLLQKYPSIKQAELALHPFWIHTLPTKASRIHISIAR